ncbi:MAG: PilZ domain-containing protein, partial [Lentisphaerota bacterium]
QNKTFFCSTDDLSVGGLRFCVHTHVPVGAKLELNVALTNPVASFKHVGRVVWVREVQQENPFAVGVQFTESAPEVLLKWKGLMERKITALQPAPKKITPSA